MRIAVEDAHDALAVAHQLADAPRVQGRLGALGRVRAGQEAGERVDALEVERVELAVEEAIEVEPVELALGLLDELEIVDGIGRGDHLARSPDESDVETPDVTREAVVGFVTVDGLPGPIGRVVVTEPLG